MDSANLQQQQQQVQLVGSSSSSPPPLPTRIGAPSYNDSNSYGASGSSHAWSTSNLILNGTSMVPNLNGGAMLNPSEGRERNDDFTLQDERFSWDGGNGDLSEKLLLKTISASGFHHMNGQDQLGDRHVYSNPGFGRSGSFSQIYPSINVPNLSQSGSGSAFSGDMDLQALDLLTNARFSGHHHHDLEMIKDSFVASSRFDHHHHHQMQEYRAPYCSPSTVLQRSAESKRGSNSTDPSHTPKKSRSDSRPSCPPLKVRKEKLGDRIAALQQLVAPFGKTDTASVLMEAIGYIQFLQNQVKTLSVPYMKSRRAMQGGSNEQGNEETRRNLRSRGLCLVPLSCMSYVAHMDGGGCEEAWPPPPSFGGGGGATLR